MAIGLSGTARADTNSVMSACSAQYKADKAANNVPAGQKWPQYYSACAAKAKTDAGSTAAASTGAATATTTKPTATAAGTSTMSTCSAQYKIDKAANNVPAGQKWPQYYSACAANLKASSAAATTSAADPTPPEPAATVTTSSTAVATTDANGKSFTPGQIAAHNRIKQCGSMWQVDKAANKIPAGQTWPKYWSACNTKLKAAGN